MLVTFGGLSLTGMLSQVQLQHAHETIFFRFLFCIYLVPACWYYVHMMCCQTTKGENKTVLTVAVLCTCSSSEWGDSSGGVWAVWQCHRQVGAVPQSGRVRHL